MIGRLLPLLLLLVAGAAAAAAPAPEPLSGVPLRGETHLRLLVANNPPFLLDVDTGRRTRISGLKLGRRSVLGVHAVGRDAILWVDRLNRPTGTPRASIYVLRRNETRAARLGTAWQVAASDEGSAVWLTSYTDATHCILREVALDGSERQGARPIPCSASLVDGGSRPLVVDGTSILDPSSGAKLLDATQLWVLVGDFAITSERSQDRSR